MTGRYDMNTKPETWPNTDDARAEAVMHAYANSGQLVQDALDWVGDHAHRHAGLVDTIVDFYVDSPECHAALEDIADGVRTVA